MKDADLELADAKRQTLDYFAGKKDDVIRKDMQAAVALQEAEVKRVRPAGGKTLALALDLLVGFYAAVRRTVDRLAAASRRMVGGDPGGTIALDSHDELAQVVHSFNEVATRLAREWCQAREESAHARQAEEAHGPPQPGVPGRGGARVFAGHVRGHDMSSPRCSFSAGRLRVPTASDLIPCG